MTALHGVIPAGGTASVTGHTSHAAGLADALGLSHPEWHADAACKEISVNFFPEPGEHDVAKVALEVCARCLCREECFAYAMADRSIVGVWGGTTTSQRAVMRSENRSQKRLTADSSAPP